MRHPCSMKKLLSQVWILLLAVAPIFAQVDGPPPDNVSNATTEEREVSWKRMLPNILDDQKRIWLFPTQVARGHHLVPAVAVLGVTAGLTAADPVEARYFRANSDSYH